MKKALFAIAVILLPLALAARELPKTQIMDVHSGKKIPFNQIFEKDKVTLVSFWATWCVPGKREVKTIARQIAGWEKQAAFNYIAIAVDQQHNETLVRPFVQAQGWAFPVYVDPKSDLKPILNFHALPYIIIIDKKGKIVFTHTGYDDGGLILAKLKELAGAGSK